MSTNKSFNEWYNTFQKQAHALSATKRVYIPSRADLLQERELVAPWWFTGAAKSRFRWRAWLVACVAGRVSSQLDWHWIGIGLD